MICANSWPSHQLAAWKGDAGYPLLVGGHDTAGYIPTCSRRPEQQHAPPGSQQACEQLGVAHGEADSLLQQPAARHSISHRARYSTAHHSTAGPSSWQPNTAHAHTQASRTGGSHTHPDTQTKAAATPATSTPHACHAPAQAATTGSPAPEPTAAVSGSPLCVCQSCDVAPLDVGALLEDVLADGRTQLAQLTCQRCLQDRQTGIQGREG